MLRSEGDSRDPSPIYKWSFSLSLCLFHITTPPRWRPYHLWMATMPKKWHIDQLSPFLQPQTYSLPSTSRPISRTIEAQVCLPRQRRNQAHCYPNHNQVHCTSPARTTGSRSLPNCAAPLQPPHPRLHIGRTSRRCMSAYIGSK